MSDTTTTTAVSTFELINIEEFTHNVVKDDTTHTVTGDGVFDILMETATKHLLAQYEANRIRGEGYATAYIEIYKATLQTALMAWIQKPEEATKVKLIEAQAKSEEMKANLYKRQIEGFDEDFKQKLLKIGLDSWAVAFSVAQDVVASDVNMIPKAMKTRTLDSLWDGAIAPDVDINKYDSRNVTTTSSSELLAQEPDYKSYQDNYNG